MKKILFLLLAVLGTQNAFADCASDLVNGVHMNGSAAQALCDQFGGAVSQSLLPGTTNTYNIGSATAAWATIFGVQGLNVTTGGEEVVAGAGATVADAAALSGSKSVHQITGANGTVGWKFVTATPVGSIQFLLNTTAGVAKVYGESGSTCNGGAADAACTLLSGIAPHLCFKTALLTYICS
jgi:hypothetical protein